MERYSGGKVLEYYDKLNVIELDELYVYFL